MSKHDIPGQKPENTPGSHKPNKGNEHVRQPDEETLGTTDPQEHMHGPVSSFIQKIKEEVEDNDEDDREEVRREGREDAGKK